MAKRPEQRPEYSVSPAMLRSAGRSGRSQKRVTSTPWNLPSSSTKKNRHLHIVTSCLGLTWAGQSSSASKAILTMLKLFWIMRLD